MFLGAYTVNNSGGARHAMTASKDRFHLALPDIDPSVALAQAARQDFTHKFRADRHAVDQLTAPDKKECAAGFAAALQDGSPFSSN